MTEPEELLTFDDLTKAYRMERSSRRLGEQRRDLYPAIRELLVRTTDEYLRRFSEDMNDVILIGLGDRMRKVQHYSARVIDLRIEKILGMAARASMGVDVAVEMLLPEERETFESAVALAQGQRDRIDVKGMLRSTSKRPKVEPVTVPEEPPKKTEPIETSVPEPIEVAPAMEDVAPIETIASSTPSEQETPAIKVEEPNTPEEIADSPGPDTVDEPIEPQNIIVRMLQDAPPFAGTHRDYRLRKEDIVTLPRIIGQALVQRKIAKEIRV